MRFGLLGPVLVERDGTTVEVAAAMPRTVLAVLLLNANTVVSSDQLAEALWGEAPPASATASLHNHVMRLRRVLGDGTRIRAVAPGYLIQVEPGELDLDSFAALCADGRSAAQAGNWAKASENLAAALALWRGTPVADLPGLSGQDARIQHLLEARSQAYAGRIAADLELGRHREVIDELRALAADRPVREAFHGQLMLALYRADRRTEALEVYQGLLRTLVDELGVEPSPSVQQLHRRILDADPELAAVVRPDRAGPRFQLPADTRVFTGRERELEELVDLARAAPGGTDAGMVVISAIDGMAGIGKTALAVHAAHRVREQFPDGQLFLDLHGFTTDLEPLTSGDALDWFLRSFNVPPQSIPQDLGERAAFYRDRLDGTRTLIVLDNAASAAQVRPLLPGSPGCLVLVTSRKRLAGLDDAHSLTLDILPSADAATLLHKVAGPGRIPERHPAVQELIGLCGHMPLAIRITAARLRHRRALRIEDVVAQLRDEGARLDHLQDEDRDLTAIFDLSYQDLPTEEQLLFRSLGLFPGPDFDAYAAAALTGADHRTAERLLDSLLDHNLLTQHTPGRYRFHDLVRVYAHSLGVDDSAGKDRDALDRLLDYYRHTARAADGRLARNIPTSLSPADPEPLAAPVLSDRSGALTWMRTERDNLMAVLAVAAALNQPARVIALTSTLGAFLLQEGPWAQAAALHLAAVDAARECGDRLGEANALYEFGRIRQMNGDLATAADPYERALRIYLELGDRHGEANALYDLGRVRNLAGDYAESGELLERSLDIFLELGNRRGEAAVLCGLARVRRATGQAAEAIELLQRALVIFREHEDGQGEANVAYELGRDRIEAGDFPAAVELLQRALAIYRELGSRHGEASALWGVSRAHLLAGQFAAAGELLERALMIYRDLGHRRNEAYALLGLGRVRLATGEFQLAGELLEPAMALFQEFGDRPGRANTLLELGRLAHARKDFPAAAELFDRTLAVLREYGHRQVEAEVFISMGALAAEATGPEEALALYREGLLIARESGNHLEQAQALEGMARCLIRVGDREAALADLREAVPIYRKVGAAETEAAAAYLAELEAAGEAVGAAVGAARTEDVEA